MSVNGKRDGFVIGDLLRCAETVSMQRARAIAVLEEVGAAVANWREFADLAGVAEKRAEEIAANHRLELAPGDQEEPASSF